MAILNELADGEGVAGGVAGSKALVGGVEEDEVALGLAELAQLAPLVGGGINTWQRDERRYRGGEVERAPVGLCAQAWKQNSEPLAAAWTSALRPLKSRPPLPS